MRAVIVCPGRGTYGKNELGALSGRRPDPSGRRAALLSRADSLRRARERIPLTELDQASRFSSGHLAGENAAALIYTASAQDAVSLRDDIEVVAVCGNSMGWYTALHVGGALDFDAGFRVVDTMGGLGRPGEQGGQLIHPLVDAQWRPDVAAVAAVREALEGAKRAGHMARWSIRLGGYAVLAGDEEGVRHMLSSLPKVVMGEREYPFQLLGHAAFHTPLMDEASRAGAALLRDVPLRAPYVPLIDGRGVIHRPKTATRDGLFAYTFGHQVVAPYDFTLAATVALREFAPDVLILLGPGSTLGGALGQILVGERWMGLASKADFQARQAETPFLIAMGRDDQYAEVGRA